MKGRVLWLLAGFLSVCAVAAESPFAGVWEGTVNELPGVEIAIHQDAGLLAGTVSFYFQTRPNESEKWRVESKTTLPLLALKVEGSVLTFEAIHHKTHGSGELGPNVRFRVELSGANEAAFSRLGTSPDPGAGLKLRRRK